MQTRAWVISLVVDGVENLRPPHGPCPPSSAQLRPQLNDFDAALGVWPALHELLLTWLPRLAPGGRMVMVVGKNLGADSLQRWLTEQGWPTERLASSKGFRVLQVASAR